MAYFLPSIWQRLKASFAEGDESFALSLSLSFLGIFFHFFLLWICRITTKSQPQTVKDNEWVSATAREWDGSPAMVQGLKTILTWFLRRNFPVLSSEKATPERAQPANVYTKLASLYTDAVLPGCPLKPPTRSPTRSHMSPSETLLWRVSICLCLSNGNWHKGRQTRLLIYFWGGLWGDEVP